MDNQEIFDVCDCCKKPIFNNDDYVMTEDGFIFHIFCNGWFYCDVCCLAYTNEAYNIAYMSDTKKVSCCYKCLELEATFCDKCKKFFLIEFVEVNLDKNLNSFCVYCSNDKK